MKQELSPEHRVDLIQYRFERAYKTLEEADYMRVGNYFNAAINRLYYACFYAATGLLIAKGIEADTHNGVKTMLSYHFVRTVNPEKPDVPLNKNDAFQKVQKRHVQEKR